MELIAILDRFYDNIIATSYIEAIAVVFAIASVIFARKENILVYPTGIIAVLLYVYICVNAKLYADMGINIFYFVLSVYGWYNWLRKGKSEKVIPITSCSIKGNALSIVAVVGFFIILSFILKNYTDSDVPFWDSLTTSIFIVGMWLLVLKKIENWIVLVIGDLISIPLYYHKGLVFSSFLFTVYLVIGISGYLAWKKKLPQNNLSSNNLIDARS